MRTKQNQNHETGGCDWIPPAALLPGSVAEIEAGKAERPTVALDYSKAGRIARLLAVPDARTASDLQEPPPAKQRELFDYRPCSWELEDRLR